jgi:hypothetical protein
VIRRCARRHIKGRSLQTARWTEPYMSREKLQDEIDEGVMFWGYEEAGALAGVMGIQLVQDVALVRHAYVRTSSQKGSMGGTCYPSCRSWQAGRC